MIRTSYVNYHGFSIRCIESVPGCTDELVCNFDETANTNDGTCDYSCYDNGDYSLAFNETGNYVEINSSYDFNVSEDQQLTIHASIYSEENGVIFQA